MGNYILRKEYFGGMIADVNKFNVSSVSESRFNAMRDFYQFLKDDKNRIRILENIVKDGMLTAPISVTIYPSIKCNTNCEFCFVKSIKDKYNEDMNYELFCKYIDKLYDAGVIDVEIMGGEPFLITWIINAIEYVSSKGMHCSINTNASLLNCDMINRLSKVENLSLRISIQEYHLDLLQDTIDLFKFCKDNSLKIDVLTVLQKKNCIFLKNLINILPKDTIKNLIILYNSPPLGNIPEYSTSDYYEITNELVMYSQTNDFVPVIAKGPFAHCLKNKENEEFIKFCDGQCMACVSRFEIMPNGDVYPCIKYYSSNTNCLGNLQDDDVYTIWNNKKSAEFRRKIDGFKREYKCGECEWNGLCSGCIGYAEGLNMHIDDRCLWRENNE